MPEPSPFHLRTAPLCLTHQWKDWSGFNAPCSYGISPEREYNAIRQAAALIDVSPLLKYDITGPDAGLFLNRIMSRDVSKLKTGRVSYLCWCDDSGKTLDDGTCTRLDETHFRVTSAAPAYHWFTEHASPYDVKIRDTTNEIAALAIQGPTSKAVLQQVVDIDMDHLRFFGARQVKLADFSGQVTRTGYTGDLGYEVWVPIEKALKLWDVLMEAGHHYGLMPVGLDALDISRIEAGFILHGADYISAHDALIESQKSTPYELGLGWTVKLDRAPFIGQSALKEERQQGSKWAFVGLEICWEGMEALFNEYDLPPNLPSAAWRIPVPVYSGNRQVGRATSGTWSPILKKNLALATVDAQYSAAGTELFIEITPEWARRKVKATVVKTPFFNPKRKRL
jgi:aminomethyltransferase